MMHARAVAGLKAAALDDGTPLGVLRAYLVRNSAPDPTMQIANHPELGNPTHVSHLPSSWGTFTSAARIASPVRTAVEALDANITTARDADAADRDASAGVMHGAGARPPQHYRLGRCAGRAAWRWICSAAGRRALAYWAEDPAHRCLHAQLLDWLAVDLDQEQVADAPHLHIAEGVSWPTHDPPPGRDIPPDPTAVVMLTVAPPNGPNDTAHADPSVCAAAA